METYDILIEGIGGIGGVVAGKLIRAGYRPTLVTGNPEITEAINRNGIRVVTPEEKFTAPAKAYSSLSQLDSGARFDAALLIMKANTVVRAARETLPFLEPENGFVVTFQNGIVEDAVADAIGGNRVVAGIIGWGGTMHGPGLYERTGPGTIHLGELDGGRTARIERIGRALELITPVVITDNIRGAQWSKRRSRMAGEGSHLQIWKSCSPQSVKYHIISYKLESQSIGVPEYWEERKEWHLCRYSNTPSLRSFAPRVDWAGQSDYLVSTGFSDRITLRLKPDMFISASGCCGANGGVSCLR